MTDNTKATIFISIFMIIFIGCLYFTMSRKTPHTLYGKLLYSINSYTSDINIMKNIKQNTDTEFSANFVIPEDKENYKYEIIIKRTKVEE